MARRKCDGCNRLLASVCIAALTLTLSVANASTTVSPSASESVAADAFEPDNTRETASLITTDVVQARTLYPENDYDWIRLDAITGGRYTVATSGESYLDTYIDCEAEAGGSLGYDDDSGPEQHARLTVTALADESIYFRVRGFDGLVTGEYTLTVTYTPPLMNHPPVAADDAYTAESGVSRSVPLPGVLGNDSDPDGDMLKTELVDGVSYGAEFVLSPSGAFTYKSVAGYTGADSFTYRAFDGEHYSEIASVDLTVTAAASNAPPVAADDAYSADSGTQLKVAAPGVLSNDTDPDGDTLIAELVTSVDHGSLSPSSSGGFTYTPMTGYVGPDSFTYRVSDGIQWSSPATVSLTVNAVSVNRPPTAVGDLYSTNAGTPLTVAAAGVLGNDKDLDHDTLTAHVETVADLHGSIAMSPLGGFTYTPAAGFAGEARFTYRAFDGKAYSTAPATVRIAVNDVTPPTTTSNAKASYVGTATITLTPTDNIGATKTLFSLDGTKWYLGRTVIVSKPGPYKLRFYSMDAHANVETTKSASFTVRRPTFLDIHATSTRLSKYGERAYVWGWLRADSTVGPRMPARTIYLQRSFTGTGSWRDVATLKTASDGSAVWSVRPRKTSYYRFRVAGSSDWFAAAYGTKVKVVPKAAVGRPSATRSGTRLYTLSGTLKPRHRSGTYAVRVYKWRRVNGHWKSYGYVKAKLSKYSSYSKYSIKHRFPRKGTWKIRAYHADAGHGASWSESRKIYVY